MTILKERGICNMANLDLTKYGITGTTEIVHNPSYELLFEEETKPELVGYEKGQVSELGAVNVMTGVYTGRSPKDKYIVMDENSKDTVWWTSDEYKNDNHPMSESTWATVKDIAKKELCNKRLFVVDAFCGANKDTRMAIRFIVEVAWQAHFVTNMFIKPTAEELENFEPDFVVYNASKAKVENYKELGLNSETCVAFNITSHEQVIINTWYGGEMKKGMFSMMNYFLPLKGMASMHCSANTDKEGKNTAIFFGFLSTCSTCSGFTSLAYSLSTTTGLILSISFSTISSSVTFNASFFGIAGSMRLFDTVVVTISLQTFLCSAQSFIWQAREQYHTDLQRPHLLLSIISHD